MAGLETDCCLTSDGQVVLVHDNLLAHATTGSGWAHERSAAYILGQRLRDRDGAPSACSPMPLAECLDAVAGRDVLLQLEVKAFADPDLAAATARAVCREVRRSRVPLERVEVISFWPGAAECAAGDGLAARLIVASPYAPEAFAAWAAGAGVSGVVLEAPYWSPAVVALWRAAGLSVMSGVCNDATMLRTILPLAPDYVASDRPYELGQEIAGDDRAS